MTEALAAGSLSFGGARKTSDLPFVLIPGNEFLMGSNQGQDDERPEHRVSVEMFELAAYQVRHADYAVFLEATGQPPPPFWNDPDFAHPEQPVVAVSWTEAVKYCDWLSRETGRKCRLPTEAEWERAARGGRDGLRFPWGDAAPEEWPEYVRRWSGEIRRPWPAGLGTPNAFGLYDIGENVHEWCADWYRPDYYAVSPPRNPKGPSSGTRRASRGGSWRHHIKMSRCSARSSIPPEFQYADYGFRVARDPA